MMNGNYLLPVSSKKLNKGHHTCKKDKSLKKSIVERVEKSKSKEAARLRRNKENDEFKNLATLLPLQHEITRQLDKASIIRLAINYLKIKELFNDCISFNEIPRYRFVGKERMDVSNFIPTCLDGFIFMLSNEARFLYVSETISAMLGLSQVAIIGTFIFDYIHPEDQEEIYKCLGGRQYLNEDQRKNKHYGSNDALNEKFCFTIRFKSSLMKKSLHGKSNGWRLLQINGRSKFKKRDSKEIDGFFGIAISINSQLSYEFELEPKSFLIKLNMNLIIESFENLPEFLKYEGNENLGKSIFNFINPIDLNSIILKFNELLKKEFVSFRYHIGSNSFNHDQEKLLVNCTGILIQKYIHQLNPPDVVVIEKTTIAANEFYEIVLVNDLVEYENDDDFNEKTLDLHDFNNSVVQNNVKQIDVSKKSLSKKRATSRTSKTLEKKSLIPDTLDRSNELDEMTAYNEIFDYNKEKLLEHHQRENAKCRLCVAYDHVPNEVNHLATRYNSISNSGGPLARFNFNNSHKLLHEIDAEEDDDHDSDDENEEPEVFHRPHLINFQFQNLIENNLNLNQPAPEYF